MVTAIGRTVLTGLILSSGVLLRPDIAEPRSPVRPPFAPAGDPRHDQEHGRGRYQFVPPGWTMYAPASPDELFMRPDEGDGMIEITCSPLRAGFDLASHATDWESRTVGPRHLLLKKQAGRMVHLGGDLTYDGMYEGDGVLARVLFARIADRVCGFLDYFLSDDFDRGGPTLDRLVGRFRAATGDGP